MKKLSSIGLLSMVVFGLAACGNQQTNTANNAASSPASSVQATAISQDQAKQIALDLVGVQEADVSNLTVKQETENGQPVFEVDFDYEGQEYSYTIDAQTGSVTEQEREQADAQVTTNLTADDARAIAFADFEIGYGVGEADVNNLTIKQDSDNGQVIYNVDFDYNGYEFSYEINAETGNIVGFDQELID